MTKIRNSMNRFNSKLDIAEQEKNQYNNMKDRPAKNIWTHPMRPQGW